ncbi:hypothetical protein KPL71_000753 [Citrus sinensis]|uniref:Uncharacterized protein n=1 Tax=Citrus sinensis TaxID=2711 RepID=A0ACB8NSV4_CITSI|nr:hypothetical protein KPL71_000753 [Citrus sinensis]
MTAQQVATICKNFDFENRFVVDRNGMGGGLALFWNSGVDVTIKSYSSHHIYAIVQNHSDKIWRCTRVYGHAEASQKHHTWTLLKRLPELYSYSWCCFGNFNEILDFHEKLGGHERSVNMVADFRETIKACDLMDMSYKGHKYTWSNRRFRGNYIEERLDRFLCSKDWDKNFQNLPATNLVSWVSDYYPIMFEVKEMCKRLNYKRRSFLPPRPLQGYVELVRGLQQHLKDDSLIFSRASVTDCKVLKEIFDCYAKASRQIFNLEKSSMFFSGRVTNNQLTFSSGGKEILIKAVAQAVPAYAISVFKLPKGLCEDIQKAIAKFWWGSKKDRHKIHWLRWDSLSKAKSRGGMGFRDLTSFNQALVAKQGWRLLRFPNSLMARVMQAKYYKTLLFRMQRKVLIPLSFGEAYYGEGNCEEDVALWHFDKRREYTVKSGYQIALNLKFPNAPTNSENGSRHWKFLWMLDLPEKIKIFMWRVIKNILHTAKHLWKRKSLQDPICQRSNFALRNDSFAIWLGTFPVDVQNVLNSVVHLE